MLKQPRVAIQIAICGFFVSVIHVGKRCFSDCEVLFIRYICIIWQEYLWFVLVLMFS